MSHKIGPYSKVLNYEIAVSRGDYLLAEGKLGDVSKKLNISPETLRYYLTEAYMRRLAKRESIDNSIIVVRIDDEEKSGGKFNTSQIVQ